MRHEVSILAIIAILGVATLLLSVNLLSGPHPAAVSLYGVAVEAPSVEDTVVARLELGEFIADEVEALGEHNLQGLRQGSIHARGSSTDYIQSLRFSEPGVFKGGQLLFERTDRGEVTDFLQFEDAIFKYTLQFSPGFTSRVESGQLRDVEGENIVILGQTMSFVDTSVDPASGRISLKLFGGFGSIEFEDSNFRDDVYVRGVKVNGKNIDALVRIRANGNDNSVTIASIEYILNANAARGGEVQVTPLHCTRSFLRDPEGMLVPNFDICYKGLQGGAVATSSRGVSSNKIYVRASGDDEYFLTATNVQGRVYKIPLAALPGKYGDEDNDLVFVEAPAPGAPNIEPGDFVVLMSRDHISGISNVLRYDRVAGDVAYFVDLAGGTKSAPINPATGEGQLLVGEGTYKFVVAPDGKLAMDQNNDGDIAGDEAFFIALGGIKLDLGPGFTVRVIVPERLFDEPAGDEVTKFDLTFGDQVDLVVPSPQGECKLQSDGGHKKCLTRYGLLIDWDKKSGSDDLTISVPSAQVFPTRGGGQGEVFISLERERLIKPVQRPAPVPKCGDGIITKPEYCDPPGSACSRPGVKFGACSSDCMSCEQIKPVCGNGLLEPGEACEANADCAADEVCSSCACKKQMPVCGNGVIEPGEACEVDADCAAGEVCSNCACNKPVVKKTNCAFEGECRVWDESCGKRMERLLEDGVDKGCVDPIVAASRGVDYCGRYTLDRGNIACNYQKDSTRQFCVCPSGPQLQAPSYVVKPSLLTRFWWWLKDLFAPPPKMSFAEPLK